VQKYAKTVQIYNKFIDFIINDTGNILSARPYFREKSGVFSYKITHDIREKRGANLVNYNINYLLIQFIADNWGGPFPDRVNRYYMEFIEARRILIENNLPLAINRAKLFYRTTPNSHLNLLDLIDICVCGLVSGIDKFVGDYTRVWCSVCIGRMVGNMIEEYSKTFLRLYPTDKKILYRANALKYRLKIETTIELTKEVNKSFEKDKKEGKGIPKLPITEDHIRTLMNGTGYVSVDSKVVNNGDYRDYGDDDGIGIYDYTPDPEQNVEEMVIKSDIMEKVISASEELDIIEKKIIRLKGVEL
jgi:DNA-directed RNA polymerase specialized sigma subunit